MRAHHSVPSAPELDYVWLGMEYVFACRDAMGFYTKLIFAMPNLSSPYYTQLIFLAGTRGDVSRDVIGPIYVAGIRSFVRGRNVW